MKYTVTIHRDEERVKVSVPALPGCWSEGDAEEQTLENIRDTMRECLAALDVRMRGEEIREVEVAVAV